MASPTCLVRVLAVRNHHASFEEVPAELEPYPFGWEQTLRARMRSRLPTCYGDQCQMRTYRERTVWVARLLKKRCGRRFGLVYARPDELAEPQEMTGPFRSRKAAASWYALGGR